MLLSIIVLLLIAAITYFHYAQGLFAATVSAFCAGAAALMAFSYHETIVAGLTGGALAAYGNAVVLCGVFALIYLILRIVIDNFLPGNVRYPIWVDRVGAGVMGIFAAFFGTAIVTIAAQELPFGPSVAMYSPYPLQETEFSVPRDLSAVYRVPPGDPAFNRGQLQVRRLDGSEPGVRQELWVPVDKWFIGLVGLVSDGGSLAGPNRFGDVYPDFKTALYGHRLGMQTSAKQTALNVAGQTHASVSAVFRIHTDGAEAQFAGGVLQIPGDIDNREADPVLRPGSGKILLLVRAKFAAGAADQGGFVRFSPGTARLVIAGKQYYPIATLESGTVAVALKPDDYLFAPRGADLIYEVDAATAVVESALAEPAFFEFKRFARVDLGGKRIFNVVTKSPDTHLQRKVVTIQQISSRVATPPRNLGEGRSRNEFNQLRASVPAQEPDPEAAEGGGAPATQASGGQPTTAPASKPAGETPEDQGGAINRLREEADRRNEALGGGGPN